MTTETIDKPTGIIKVDKGKLQIQLYVGILILPLAFFIPMAAFYGVLLITMYFVNSNIEVVRFYSKYSEVKQGLIRSRWLIANSAVVSAKKLDEHIVLTLMEDEKLKTRKITLKPISEDGQKSILKYYQAQARKSKHPI